MVEQKRGERSPSGTAAAMVNFGDIGSNCNKDKGKENNMCVVPFLFVDNRKLKHGLPDASRI